MSVAWDNSSREVAGQGAVASLRMLSARLTWWLVLRQCVRMGAVGCLSAGFAVLLLRVALGVPANQLFWLLGVFIPLGAWAVISALRARPSRAAMLAELDKVNRCGGLLMTQSELHVGSWPSQVQSIPTLHWRAAKPVAAFFCSAVFLIAALATPQRFVTISPGRLMVEGDANQLKHQIETLQKEDIIKPEQARELSSLVDQLQHDAQGDDPAKTFEALEHIDQKLQQAASDAAQQATASAQQAQTAKAMAQTLLESSQSLTADMNDQAMESLAKMVENAAAESEMLSDALGDELSAACENGTLSQAQLQELSARLGGQSQLLKARLGRLCDAGLIDAQTMEKCLAELAEDDLSDAEKAAVLDAICAACEDGSDPCKAAMACRVAGRKPGRGGVTRGRGDADLTLGDESDAQAAKFEKQVLRPSAAGADQAQLVGITRGAPQTQPAEATDVRGGLSEARTGAGAAPKQVILPQHRQAVADYFEK